MEWKTIKGKKKKIHAIYEKQESTIFFLSMKKEKDLIKNEFFFFFDKNMHVSPDLRLLTHENCRNRDKTHLKMGIRPRSKGFFGD